MDPATDAVAEAASAQPVEERASGAAVGEAHTSAPPGEERVSAKAPAAEATSEEQVQQRSSTQAPTPSEEPLSGTAAPAVQERISAQAPAAAPEAESSADIITEHIVPLATMSGDTPLSFACVAPPPRHPRRQQRCVDQARLQRQPWTPFPPRPRQSRQSVPPLRQRPRPGSGSQLRQPLLHQPSRNATPARHRQRRGERTSVDAPAASTGAQHASATHAEPVSHTSSHPPPSAATPEPVPSTTVAASPEVPPVTHAPPDGLPVTHTPPQGPPATHAPPAASTIADPDPDPAAGGTQLPAAALATGASEVPSRPVGAEEPEPGVGSSPPPPPHAGTAAATEGALPDTRHGCGHSTDDDDGQDHHAGGVVQGSQCMHAWGGHSSRVMSKTVGPRPALVGTVVMGCGACLVDVRGTSCMSRRSSGPSTPQTVHSPLDNPSHSMPPCAFWAGDLQFPVTLHRWCRPLGHVLAAWVCTTAWVCTPARSPVLSEGTFGEEHLPGVSNPPRPWQHLSHVARAAAAASQAHGPRDVSPSALCCRLGEVEPVRHYLESTVVPVLRQALRQLVHDRPDDPYDYLANYILKHKPV
ncbi:MAG: hypothetical protein WDW38_005868 [Sanguina aurantia]